MILVDANILMYAAGTDHPNKALAVAFLEKVASGKIVATVDAEILQEIIHRYVSLRRWPEGRRVYELARCLFPEVLAITGAVTDRAKEIVEKDETLSARDAVHAAAVFFYRLQGICSFDTDFDRIDGCGRVPL